ncbi:hypothetical protein NED98_17860 [Sphingomonas sp. MMSM20]|uniref:hypothetical protein n=1 Tax=Sphingomonas lycopersici TaxID=2951807 RepID=UPI002237BDB0|nr:hypothetical protein [Sphingomonas lycopersici]MCW6532118.1 hypothetical protein [Sphingomonas lycopersici]
MILLPALLLLAPAANAPAPAASAPAPDVVVTSLRKLRIATQVDGGKVTGCHARVSSGDEGIDRAACAATVTCFNGGVTQPEPLADCVEAKVAALVRERGGQ